MDFIFNHAADWLILFILMGGALYTLKIIRQESTDFIDESYEIRFGRLGLPIPNWWSVTRQENQLIEFARTDTHYDWYARFEFIPDPTERALTDILHEKIVAEELDYDPADVVIETEVSRLIKDPAAQCHFTEIIRVEGKATQRVEERVYLDIYLFRHRGEGGHYQFESRSSVLSGMVEGPFFEECVSRLKLAEN